MAPLNGTTLGEKHRNYNTMLEQTIAKGPVDLPKINFDNEDIDNMMRIDIACNERNVEYIIEVLKCDDMLYVTRAIKRSLWIITERKYAQLINPEYLHLNVFPDMTAKAITKLMIYIRRHLKDENRAETFFTYVDKNNPKMALKWLENCSLKFTEEIVASRASSISSAILRRLCKKSVRIFKIYVDNVSTSNRYITFDNVMFLLKSDTEEFLNITECLPTWRFKRPSFNCKGTLVLMKRCFQRIVDSFSIYKSYIDLPTFVKYLKINKVDIESFLSSRCERCWLNFDNLKPFLDELPQERIVNLLINLYGFADARDYSDGNSSDDVSDDSDVDAKLSDDTSDSLEGNLNKITSDDLDVETNEVEGLFYRIECHHNTFSQVYRWYEFAPFEKTFIDLQKLIYAESSPEERQSMLIVLLKSARKNMDLVRTVLQYYHDNHINEPYIQKNKFVNSLMTLHDAFRFNDITWNILNEIFHSLEVYIQSTNKLRQCIVTVILFNILHDQSVPEVVEQKFIFDTLKDIKKKLNTHEQEKLFDYLYYHMEKKVRAQDLNRETGIKQAIEFMENLWRLIKDWNKEATHHRFVIDNIIKLSNINKELKDKEIKISMQHFYCLVKPYNRQLFENSLLLYPYEDMCIHALKHDPGLLVRYEDEVGALCCDDRMSLRRLLSKLRIYWRESLASKWRNTFINNIENFIGHKALVRGIFILSSQMQLVDFIKKHAPSEKKILWNESIEVEISLQKHIAKNLHLARPQLPAEVVLWYAIGDYLQYTQLSLNVIYHNLRSKDIEQHINKLLSAPVSLQKHGIRLASKRMKIHSRA